MKQPAIDIDVKWMCITLLTLTLMTLGERDLLDATVSLIDRIAITNCASTIF